MNQKSRPDMDILVNGWTLTPVFSKVNEPVPNDSTFVTTAVSPQGAMFVVKLRNLEWPQEGTQTLTTRIRKTDSNDLPITVCLRQGQLLIAVETFEPTQSFEDYSIELTADQQEVITDYTDLNVTVIAGAISVDCCPSVTLPAVVHATYSNGSNGCEPLNGTTVPLVWNGVSHTGVITCPWQQGPSGLDFRCLSGLLRLSSSGCAQFSALTPLSDRKSVVVGKECRS